MFLDLLASELVQHRWVTGLSFLLQKIYFEVKGEHLTVFPDLGLQAKATKSAGPDQLKGPSTQSAAPNNRNLGKGIMAGTRFLMKRRG